MRILGVIPARMGSSRFPGKPLAPIGGRPMIEHVYRGTVACRRLHEVVVATCDDAIVRAAASFGARTVLTSAAHERASDRVAEVCRQDSADVVVMVQGDEPMIRPSMVDEALAPLMADPAVSCVNLAAPIATEAEFLDPNTIKVVRARSGRALYFSRAPIPSRFEAGTAFKQVCVIAFRRDALLAFAELPPTPLEIAESVDMLRLLEHGRPVHLALTTGSTHAVDTPEDLARVRVLMGAG